jgi:hypothetical protein
MVRRALLLAATVVVSGCTPELDDRSFLVDRPRLLAIASSPAEAAPPAMVSYRALYVDQDGERSADLEWSFCIARKALADQGTVSPACIAPSGEGLVPIGAGETASGALPMDGCRLFGPNPPDPVDGQPAGRPVDPDPSGGFYQPLRLLVRDGGDTYAIGATRIACGLSGATPEVSADFTKRYRKNENPAIASLSLDGVEVPPFASGASAGATVSRGATVKLRAAWAACAEDASCTGAERYLVFDPDTRALVEKREAIRVAWFATAGTLQDDSGGRGADEADQTSLDNVWTAPSDAGQVRLWLVIRDDRGGVGWEEVLVRVE